MSDPRDPGSELPVPVDAALPAEPGWALDLAAATLRIEGGDADALLDGLGAKLERILGRRASIERRGGLRRRNHVGKITVDLDGERLEAVAARTGPTFLAVHVVRGVSLKTEEIGADEWVSRLVTLVGREAERSASVREALGQVLDP